MNKEFVMADCKEMNKRKLEAGTRRDPFYCN